MLTDLTFFVVDELFLALYQLRYGLKVLSHFLQRKRDCFGMHCLDAQMVDGVVVGSLFWQSQRLEVTRQVLVHFIGDPLFLMLKH